MFIIPTSLFRNIIEIIIHYYYFDIAGLVHSLDAWIGQMEKKAGKLESLDGKLESLDGKPGKPGKPESPGKLESQPRNKKDRTGIPNTRIPTRSTNQQIGQGYYCIILK